MFQQLPFLRRQILKKVTLKRLPHSCICTISLDGLPGMVRRKLTIWQSEPLTPAHTISETCSQRSLGRQSSLGPVSHCTWEGTAGENVALPRWPGRFNPKLAPTSPCSHTHLCSWGHMTFHSSDSKKHLLSQHQFLTCKTSQTLKSHSVPVFFRC